MRGDAVILWPNRRERGLGSIVAKQTSDCRGNEVILWPSKRQREPEVVLWPNKYEKERGNNYCAKISSPVMGRDVWMDGWLDGWMDEGKR